MASDVFPSLRLLRSFLAVADCGHFRQAAEVCGVPQPVLSRHVQQMEKELGCLLFERSTKKVRLTEAGAYLFRHAPAVLEQAGSLVSGCRAAAAGQAGVLRIGYSGAAMSSFLSLALRLLQKRHPRLELQLREGTSRELVEGLSGERHDLIFPLMTPENPEMDSVPLLRERIGAVLPDDHRLAEKKRLSLKDVRGEPLVLFARPLNPVLYDEITRCCREAGFTAEIVAEASPRSAAISLVAAGKGITFLTERLAHLCIPGTVHRMFTGPAPINVFVMAWLRHRRVSAAEELLDLIRGQIRG